ncbi:MAG: SsrA-binding protein SmpB [Tissierellia bacterium]|nr:SsrA-binding protein SmpB [Tissierellia bacterium]
MIHLKKEKTKKTLATNRKARHEFFIEEIYEAGLVLKGTEVKSIRQGKANLKEAFAVVENGEVFIHGMHISPYEQGNIFNVDPVRKRKLLLNKREIRKIHQAVSQKGMTMVILSLYLNNGRVKAELALARGKKLYDKRDAIAEKTAQRRIDRELKERYN